MRHRFREFTAICRQKFVCLGFAEACIASSCLYILGLSQCVIPQHLNATEFIGKGQELSSKLRNICLCVIDAGDQRNPDRNFPRGASNQLLQIFVNQ